MDGGGDDHHRKRKQSSVKSSRIDHTYYDFSTRHLSELLPPEKIQDANDKKGRVTFPMKLHGIVSNPRYRHIICWMPHGRSWKILDKELLASVVCRENFNHENFDSINRSINGWGFKRLMRAGPDHKSYYHELFLRGRPELAQAMTRLINPGKRIPDPKGEPDFYEIAQRFPLPADPHDVDQNVDEHEQSVSPPQVAYDPSALQNFAQAQPHPAVKRQRQERHSFPPAQPSGFAQQHGYPGIAYDYGYGHYPPPYHQYPNLYNYPASPYPHFPHPNENHYPYHPYVHWHHQHGHYPYDADRASINRRDHSLSEGHEEYIQQPDPNSIQRHMSPEQIGPHANVQPKSPPSQNKHGSASSEKPSDASAGQDTHPSPGGMAKHQYVFPSYGTSSFKTPHMGYQHPTAAMGSSTSSNENKDKSAEIDDRKPSANKPPTTPANARSAPDVSITPVRANQRLEWTESFSSDVCNYLLEDDARKPVTKEEKEE